MKRSNLQIRLSLNKHDLWIGAYWKIDGHTYWQDSDGYTLQDRVTIYVCLIPIIPIKISWDTERKENL